MALVVGLIGSQKGKIGNVVYRTRRGKQIASVYQPTVANPKTGRQQVSRAKMALAVDTLKPLGNFLKAGWQRRRAGYELQQAIGLAIPVSAGVITGGYPEGTPLAVAYAELNKVMSADDIPAPAFDGLDLAQEAIVSVATTAEPADFLEPDGSPIGCGFVVAVYNPAAKSCVVASHAYDAAGSSMQMDIDVPADWSGMTVYVYGFAKQIPNATNGIPATVQPWMYPARTSVCKYLGTGTIA